MKSKRKNSIRKKKKLIKAKDELGFIPRYSDLETIITTAWDWHKKQLE